MKWLRLIGVLFFLLPVVISIEPGIAQTKGDKFYSGPCRLEDFPAGTPLYPVKGRVIDDVTGKGIAGATVHLNSACLSENVQALAGRMKQETVTDEEGNFTFQDVPKMAVLIEAAKKDHYYLEPWGFRRHADDPIRMYRIGPESGAITLRVAPSASISGMVRDEKGAPVPDVWVSLWRYSTWEGWPQLQFWNAEKANLDGSYHRDQLPPGRYYLIASPELDRSGFPFAHDNKGNGLARVPVRFPPQPPDQDDDAFLRLREGQELKVDFRMAPTVVHHVTGRIEGGGKWGASLSVIGQNGGQYFFKSPPLCCDFESWVPNGRFRFAADGMNSEGSFRASQGFQVRDADLTDIVVPIGPGTESAVPIRVTFSPSRIPSCAQTHMGCAFLNVWLIRHMDNGYFVVGPQPTILLQQGRDGSLPVESVSGSSGTYSVIVSTSFNVYAESIVRDSVDLTVEPLVLKPGDSGSPIQIVLAQGAIVEGTTMASGKPSAAFVYAIPTRPDGRLFHAANSDPQGKFRIEGLAPAEYTIFATDVQLDINLRNPKEIDYWQAHGQHMNLQAGSSSQVVLQETSFPAEMYPREAPPEKSRD